MPPFTPAGPRAGARSRWPTGRQWQKKEPGILIAENAGQIPGDDLLSQDLSSHYHRRCGVSLPGSEWDRVVPPRSGHQRSTPLDRGWDSGGPPSPGELPSNRLPDSFRSSATRPLSDIHTEIFHLFPNQSARILRSPSKNSDFEWNQAIRMISTGKLHMLPHFHFQPINVVVFHDPSGKTHLGRSLALRCFQRLSLPHIATRPCR